jgi:predicted nucleotidyltransferase/predicted transcriptional regulator
MYLPPYRNGITTMLNKDIVIMKYLLDNKDKESNINTIAKALKMDYKNVHTIVKRLEKKQAISIDKFGNVSKISLNSTPNPLLFSAEYERRQDLFNSKDMQQVQEYFLRHMKTSFYVMLLFGSHAKKKQTESSDIDLLFVVPTEFSENVEKDILSIGRLLPLKLHIHVFSEKDFTAMNRSKEITVGSEAIKHNVILHSIEQYYELIQ